MNRLLKILNIKQNTPISVLTILGTAAIVVMIVLSLAGCAPSVAAIQTAIANTEAAKPTAIPTSIALVQATTQAFTNTPTTTDTPKPTETPTETETPAPTETPNPTATQAPTPQPVIFTGSGNSVVDITKGNGAALLHIKYTGSGNFAIWNYDATGEKIDLLVNNIGNYEGTVPLDFREGESTARLEINATDQWKIELLPFASIKTVAIPGVYKGTGDDVIYFIGNKKPDLLKMDASKAQGNFAIWGYGNDVDLLANEIAPYTGTVVIDNSLLTDSGGVILVISTEGEWSVEFTVR